MNNCYDNTYCIKLKWLNEGILNQKFDMRLKVGNKKLKSSWKLKIANKSTFQITFSIIHKIVFLFANYFEFVPKKVWQRQNFK